MNNYNIVKLINGTMIVGDTVHTPEDVLVSRPLEVYAKPVQDGTGKVIGEHMVLRPYLVMTEERDVVIDTYNVLFTSKLDKRLYRTYEEMADTVYEKGMSYDDRQLDEIEGAEDFKDLNDEETEYLKEVLEGLSGNKKDEILH